MQEITFQIVPFYNDNHALIVVDVGLCGTIFQGSQFEHATVEISEK